MKPTIAILLFIVFSCTYVNKENSTAETVKPVDLAAEAQRLSHELIIIDGHVDLPERLSSKMEDISVKTSGGHFDYVRAKEGGMDAPFMSIYIPASYENNGALELALKLMGMVEKIYTDHPDKFAPAKTPADIEANFAKKLISLPMGLENGAPLEGKLDNLNLLYDKGIRYITLTHSKDNHISDSSYDTKRTNGGLSPFGYKVIDRMNELGMMIDVAHVSDSAFYQAVKVSKTPVIASHSSCRHFTPGFERNVSDEMIKLLADRGGVIMISFGSVFLTEKGNKTLMGIYEKLFAGADSNDPAIRAELDSAVNSPDVLGNVSVVADHIDHVVQVAGIDHIGLGSDFDGVENLPIGLEDVSKIPALIEELLKRGYSEEDIAKICSKNIMRVWNEVIEYTKK